MWSCSHKHALNIQISKISFLSHLTIFFATADSHSSGTPYGSLRLRAVLDGFDGLLNIDQLKVTLLKLPSQKLPIQNQTGTKASCCKPLIKSNFRQKEITELSPGIKCWGLQRMLLSNIFVIRSLYTKYFLGDPF